MCDTYKEKMAIDRQLMLVPMDRDITCKIMYPTSIFDAFEVAFGVVRWLLKWFNSGNQHWSVPLCASKKSGTVSGATRN